MSSITTSTQPSSTLTMMSSSSSSSTSTQPATVGVALNRLALSVNAMITDLIDNITRTNPNNSKYRDNTERAIRVSYVIQDVQNALYEIIEKPFGTIEKKNQDLILTLTQAVKKLKEDFIAGDAAAKRVLNDLTFEDGQARCTEIFRPFVSINPNEKPILVTLKGFFSLNDKHIPTLKIGDLTIKPIHPKKDQLDFEIPSDLLKLGNRTKKVLTAEFMATWEKSKVFTSVELLTKYYFWLISVPPTMSRIASTNTFREEKGREPLEEKGRELDQTLPLDNSLLEKFTGQRNIQNAEKLLASGSEETQAVRQTLLEHLAELINEIKRGHKNKDFQDYVEIEGKTSNYNPHSQMISKIVADFTKSDEPVLALQGEGGAGKSLSIKMLSIIMILRFLTLESESLTLYVRLGEIEDIKDFIKKFFNQSIFDKVKDMIRNLPLVWMLDGYDEVIPKDENPTRLREQILEFYPNSKIILISRIELNFLDEFQVPDKDLPVFFIQPFNQKQRNQFIENFVKKQPEDSSDEKGNSYSPNEQNLEWDSEDYKKHIENFSIYNGWKSILNNPLRLKITLESLPTLYPTDQKNNKFYERSYAEISDALFAEYTCKLVKRSSQKTTGKYAPVDFLNYAVDLAAKMKETNRQTISFNLRDEERAAFESFFTFDKKVLYLQELNYNTGNWGFIHADYHNYLASLKTNKVKLANLLQRL